jgi:hypothetical protein
MRAAVLDRYGPPEVLRIEDVERPVPARGEVLIRVHAATVNRNDTAWRRASPLVQRAVSGWRRPKAAILGNEFAGTVTEVGTEVSRFSSGDEVFGVRAYLSEGFGAQAEYLSVSATSAIALKPPNVSFEQAAAACDGALSALPFLRVETWLNPPLMFSINSSVSTTLRPATPALRRAHSGKPSRAYCSGDRPLFQESHGKNERLHLRMFWLRSEVEKWIEYAVLWRAVVWLAPIK